VAAGNTESSPGWDTSWLAELTYDLINRQFVCGKCPKPVTIQYLHAAVVSKCIKWVIAAYAMQRFE